MKRKLFFWLENLKITKAERVSVTVLMAILLIVTLIRSLIPVSSPYDEQYYSALETEFKKRTEILRQKENAILARYHPEIEKVSAMAADTIPADSIRRTPKRWKVSPVLVLPMPQELSNTERKTGHLLHTMSF